MSITRRSFLAGSVASLAACAVDPFDRDASVKALARKPLRYSIKHVVVVMMENRSFDHFLGWLPGADGRQAGLAYPDPSGGLVPTFALAPDYQGCSYADPDHSFEGGRIAYNNGACDGWLVANPDPYSIGYYTEADLPFLARAARDWTVCDRYFAAIMAPTTPNRLYQHCAVTDRIDSSTTPTTLPTIWDQLAARDLVGRYYFSDVPFLGLWGTRYAGITRPYAEFLADCASGELPQVAFVDPPFAGEEAGGSSDDHPHGDIRAGETFLAHTYAAITRSPAWRHTVLVINFDEWGGFFDHVPPPAAADVDPRFELRGFRVPCIVISPFARRGFVANGIYDHTSVLTMIESLWNLPPLSIRDANANNLADVLDTSTLQLAAPAYSVPDVVSVPCIL
jgi:phospholipase C